MNLSEHCRQTILSRMGLLMVAGGFAALALSVLRELLDPFFGIEPPQLLFLFPLAIGVSGTFLLHSAVPASAACRSNLFQIRMLAVGSLALAPFTLWATRGGGSVYLSLCAFGALTMWAVLLRQLCEYVRLFYSAAGMQRWAVRCQRVKQLHHFLVLVPVVFVAVVSTRREYEYGLKASYLLEIAWRNASAMVRIAVQLILFATLGTVLALLAFTALRGDLRIGGETLPPGSIPGSGGRPSGPSPE